MYRNINNYYFSRPNYGYAYANPYGMNFSRSYPRVVIYNGQQNFNIHDAFPEEYREEMIKDSKHEWIKDMVSKNFPIGYYAAPHLNPMLSPRGKRAIAAAQAKNRMARRNVWEEYHPNEDDVATVQAAIAGAKALRHTGDWNRMHAWNLIRNARPAMDRINKDMVAKNLEKMNYAEDEDED